MGLFVNTTINEWSDSYCDTLTHFLFSDGGGKTDLIEGNVTLHDNWLLSLSPFSSLILFSSCLFGSSQVCVFTCKCVLHSVSGSSAQGFGRCGDKGKSKIKLLQSYRQVKCVHDNVNEIIMKKIMQKRVTIVSSRVRKCAVCHPAFSKRAKEQIRKPKPTYRIYQKGTYLA